MADIEIHLDTTQVAALARDLASAEGAVIPGMVRIMGRAGLAMKTRMQREASGFKTLPHVPRSITYDVVGTATGVRVDVGPDPAKKQGNLAWIGYDGTSRRGPLYPEPQAILDDQAETTELYLSALLDEHLT